MLISRVAARRQVVACRRTSWRTSGSSIFALEEVRVNDRWWQGHAPLAVWQCNAGVRSRPAWLPSWAFAAWRSLLSRRCRLDTERLSRRSLWLGPEERPAAGRELGFVPDHADGDAVDIRNFGTAQAKRVAAAGLLLLGGIGLAWRGPHRNRERARHHQAELNIPGPDPKHESPQRCSCELWVNGGEMARRTERPATTCRGKEQRALRLERPDIGLANRAGPASSRFSRVSSPTLPA